MHNGQDHKGTDGKEGMRKRREFASQEDQVGLTNKMVNAQVGQDDRTHGYFLDLSLSLSARTSKTPPPPSLPPPPIPPPPHEGPLSLQSNFLIPPALSTAQQPLQPSFIPIYNPASPMSSPRSTAAPPPPMASVRPILRLQPRRCSPQGKSPTIPPPFPWATDQRATVHSLAYLMALNITTIRDQVQCKRCEQQYEIGFNVREKFVQIGVYILENKDTMHHRAPSSWTNPTFPTCGHCNQQNGVRPIIAKKKKSINWLFLFLGEMIGYCRLPQLKYFCKHTRNHRTGAKDRLVYITYLGLCKQLDPNFPFDD
ncbi:hypothetical protein RJ641_019407 [Dillenia turbinata]|uniref:DUF7086 domain-containing protein n=1 Tax=Dillenia turbinata TaxID=194707 RepID=A0AAN8YXC3_9MAGN